MLNSCLLGSQLWGLVWEPSVDMAHHRGPVHQAVPGCPTSWVGHLSWAGDGGQGVEEEGVGALPLCLSLGLSESY